MTGLRPASCLVVVLVACVPAGWDQPSGDDIVLSGGTGSTGQGEEDSGGPPGCAHACEEGAAVCQDAGLSLCVAGEDGCRRWGEPEACPEGQVCGEGACAPAPGFSRLGDAWPLPDGGRAGEGFAAGAGEPGAVGDEAWSLFDIDGDGSLDLVVTAVAHKSGNDWVTRTKGYPLATFWEVYFGGRAGGYGSEPHTWEVPPAVGLTGRGLVAPSGLPSEATDHAWALRDVNGDGRPDLLVTGYGAPKGDLGQIDPLGTVDAPRWDVYFNDGERFAAVSTPWPLSPGLSIGTADGAIVGASGLAWSTFDADGDGWCDVVLTGSGYPLAAFGMPDKPQWLVYRGSPGGVAGEPLAWRLPPGGAADVGFAQVTGAGAAAGDELWSLVDIDGDRRRELVVTGVMSEKGEPTGLLSDSGAPQWRVYRSVAVGFDVAFEPYAVPAGRGGSDDRGLYAIRGGQDAAGKLGAAYDRHGWDLIDVDGDRRLDLVVTNEAQPYEGVYTRRALGGESDPYWEVYFGTAEGFAAPLRWPTPPGGAAGRGFLWTRGLVSPVPQVEGASMWETGDLDGDGRPELVVTGLAAPGEAGATWHWEAPGYVEEQPHWQVYWQAAK